MTDPLIKFIRSVCVQKIVYWSTPANDGYGGKSYATPVEIDARYEMKTELINKNNGEEVVSKTQVLLDQDVDEGGLVYLGRIDDLTASQQSSPETINENIYSILLFEKTPLFRSSTEFVRRCYL